MKDVELLYEIDPDVSIYQRGDIGRIRQVLMNLVSNGLKFTEQGAVIIKVKKPSEKTYQIVVSDTGVGFDSHQADFLFTPFQQADASTTRKYGGTGLGLAICKRLVELMGGSVSVSSKIGKGSDFTITLPNNEGKYVKEVSIHSESLKGIRVLVTDDNPINLTFMKARLSSWGAEVHLATSADEALDILKKGEEEFDILLTDMLMPGIDGFEMATLTKDICVGGGAPMVLVTSSREEEVKHKALKVGYKKVIYKPVKQKQLFEVIDYIVNKKEIAVSQVVSKDSDELDDPCGSCVLVVEDNPVNAKLAELLLKRFGLKIQIAQDGQEAIKILSNNSEFCAIFMDVQMPVMDGFEATKRIRLGQAGNKSKSIPIIAMTANAMAEDEVKCISSGMDAYLSKPISLDKFKEILCQFKILDGPIDN